MIKRKIGLDIFRIILVLLVFLFHSNMHIGCDYKILNNFIKMGAIAMTGFFMLSGFTLFLTNSNSDFTSKAKTKTFYMKRLISILPAYYMTALLYIVFIGNETLTQNIWLAPIEILGLQSIFTSVFAYSHNGGTWFISCLLICYIFYPFLQELVKQMAIKNKFILLGLCFFILLYSPFIVENFGLATIYDNPWFRLIEFIIGVILASFKSDYENNVLVNKYLFKWKFIILEGFALLISVSFAVYLKIGLNNYMLYNWIGLPIFSLMIISFSGVKINLKGDFKILRYLSSISYDFFLAQFFTWKLTMHVMNVMNLSSNILRISFSLLICIILTILLHELIEKPICSRLRNTFIKA